MQIIKTERAKEWHANGFDKFLYWYGAIVTPIVALYALIDPDETAFAAILWIGLSAVAIMTLSEIAKDEYIARKPMPKFGYCLAWFVLVTTTLGFLVGFAGAL